MSATIYLDHNVVVGVAGRPAWADATVERDRIEALQAQGVQFVLSAWHMYELAKSEDPDNVRGYCQFVEALKPLWAKNPIAVKRAELRRFLADPKASADWVSISPFSDTVDAMWASYELGGIQGETLSGVVRELRADPSFLQEMNEAAELTPDAITTGRDAYQDGRLKAAEAIIDRGYFAGLLECLPSDPRVEGLLRSIKPIYRACPTIAVEDVLMQVRTKDSFTPRASHASDFQHALIGLAYCTAFVTDDTGLFENARVTVKRLNLPTTLSRRVAQVALT
jgi:hypothetical protein